MDVVEFKTPSVLFIKGVFIKDCVPIDDLFDEQVMARAQDDPVEIHAYTPIPTIFHSVKTWPTSTNIRCYYCDRSFDETPIFVPKTIEPSNEGYVMSTEGCFCTFNCAVTYIDLHYPKIHDNINKKSMLKLLYSVMHNKHVAEIPSALSKYEMICYGGRLSQQEYGKRMPKITGP